MAVDPGLSPRARRQLLALVAAVVLGHGVALHVFSRWQAQVSLLRPMVAPMYTRLLQPEKPAEPALAAKPAPAPAPAPPPTRLRAAPSVPKATTRTLAESPEPPAEPAAAAAPAVPEPAPAETVAQGRPEPLPEPLPEAVPLPAAAPAPPDGSVAPTPAPTEPPAATGSAAAAAEPASRLDGWPTDTRLSYRLGGRFRSGELYGDARVLWQRQASRYQVRVEVDLTFLASLVLTSQGEVGPGSLMPEVYEEVRNGKPRGLRMGESEVMLANGKVLRRPPGVQDTASQFVELSHRFASGLERLEVGGTVSFWMARPGAVDLWTYDIVASEMLATKLGNVEAFHLKPRPIANPRGNITAEMWFAPSLQYLPVRIRVNMGEEAHIDLLVEAIEQR